MINCLTVTQAGRLELLARAVADFRVQTVRERELVIIHDGNPAFHYSVLRLAADGDEAPIRVVLVAAGLCLGALRNAATEAARGDYVCQWDDDDRYHPNRLEVQLEALRSANRDCSFLADQPHLFAEHRQMYWDYWYNNPYPTTAIPSTLFARRASLPRYPDATRGEDSAVLAEMLAQGSKVVKLRERGYLYFYVFHGRSVFEGARHASITGGGVLPRPVSSASRSRCARTWGNTTRRWGRS
jgi:glycosyltransferase involved in cell wall biosynthesis